LSLSTVKVSEFIQNTLKHIGCWRLSTMNSSCKEDYWLVCFDSINWRNRHHSEISSFDWLRNNFFFEKDIIVLKAFFFDLENTVLTIVISIWIDIWNQDVISFLESWFQSDRKNHFNYIIGALSILDIFFKYSLPFLSIHRKLTLC
jgi:hypothetical protein